MPEFGAALRRAETAFDRLMEMVWHLNYGRDAESDDFQAELKNAEKEFAAANSALRKMVQSQQ